MADRDALIKGFLKRNKPPRREGSLNLGNEEGSLSPGRLKRANRKYAKGRIMEDDPRWVQQLAHGQGQERKVGANVTLPRAYVTGGSRRGRTRP